MLVLPTRSAKTTVVMKTFWKTGGQNRPVRTWCQTVTRNLCSHIGDFYRKSPHTACEVFTGDALLPQGGGAWCQRNTSQRSLNPERNMTTYKPRSKSTRHKRPTNTTPAP